LRRDLGVICLAGCHTRILNDDVRHWMPSIYPISRPSWCQRKPQNQPRGSEVSIDTLCHFLIAWIHERGAQRPVKLRYTCTSSSRFFNSNIYQAGIEYTGTIHKQLLIAVRLVWRSSSRDGHTFIQRLLILVRETVTGMSAANSAYCLIVCVS